jgi:hypothetical protein
MRRTAAAAIRLIRITAHPVGDPSVVPLGALATSDVPLRSGGVDERHDQGLRGG